MNKGINLILNIPKEGLFKKYHSKKQQIFLQRKYECIERLKSSRVRFIETPYKQKGLYAKEIASVFSQGLIYRVVSLSEGIIINWNNNHPLLSVLASRSLIETISLAFYYIDKSEEYIEKENFDSFKKLSLGLTLSFPGNKPGKDVHNIPSISSLVDYFDRKYLKKSKTVRESYDFLSNIVHPNWPGTLGFFSYLIRSENRHYFRSDSTKLIDIIPDLVAVLTLVPAFENFVEKFQKTLIHLDDV